MNVSSVGDVNINGVLFSKFQRVFSLNSVYSFICEINKVIEIYKYMLSIDFIGYLVNIKNS